MGQFETPLEFRIAKVLSRVLIIDDQVSRINFMADLLRNFKCTVRKAPNIGSGMSLAAAWDPQAIVVSHDDGGLDGVAFTRDLRRSGLDCRRAAVIIQLSRPTGAAIAEGRDAGAHEFLVHPVRLADLARRLEAALLRPRGWVEAPGFVGPDRRRLHAGGYRGPDRRVASYHSAEIAMAQRPMA